MQAFPLMSRTIKDSRLVSLIHRYLNAGVINCGKYQPTQLGLSQGGPLSPILSNIMLNELDKELERRGHKFVRYADDLLIFCKSRKAAHRTYDHIVPFIEGKLFLKVNREKTKVAYIRDIKFLSYAFGRRNGKCQYLLHPESIKKMKHKIRELTSRSNGWGYEYRKERLQWYICGWSNYFSVAGYKNRLEEWDSWLRHRIRMCIWKSWKRVRTRYHNLKKLVPDENRVRIAAFCRKSYWRMSSHPTVHEAMSDERLLRAGYPTFAGCYVDFNKAKVVLVIMEPPYAERHVRWCERTHEEIILMLLHIYLIFRICYSYSCFYTHLSGSHRVRASLSCDTLS